MTEPNLSDATRAMLAHRCGYCDVAPGTWCRTASGMVADELHADRYNRWQDALRDAADDDDRYVVTSDDARADD